MVPLLNISTGFYFALPYLCIVIQIIIHFQGFITINKQMICTLHLSPTSPLDSSHMHSTNQLDSIISKSVCSKFDFSLSSKACFPPDLNQFWEYYHLPSCPNQKSEIQSWFIRLSSHSHTSQLQIQLLVSPKYTRKRKSISPDGLCHKPSPSPLSFLTHFSTIASQFLVCPLFTTVYKAYGDILTISVSSHHLPA